MGTTQNQPELSTVIHSLKSACGELGRPRSHRLSFQECRPGRASWRFFGFHGPTKCHTVLSRGCRYPQVAVICPQLLHNHFASRKSSLLRWGASAEGGGNFRVMNNAAGRKLQRETIGPVPVVTEQEPCLDPLQFPSGQNSVAVMNNLMAIHQVIAR